MLKDFLSLFVQKVAFFIVCKKSTQVTISLDSKNKYILETIGKNLKGGVMFKKLFELKEIGTLMLNTFQAYLYRKTKCFLKYTPKQL